MIGYGTGQECDYCHATTVISFLNQPGHVFIQNQDYPAGCWAERLPEGTDRLCDYISYEDAFDRYKAFMLYYLQPRVVDDTEYKRLRNELDWVMSGNHNEELIKTIEAESGKKGGQKGRRKARSAFSNKKERARKANYYNKRQNMSAK